MPLAKDAVTGPALTRLQELVAAAMKRDPNIGTAAGISGRTLYRVVSETKTGVTFGMADRLVTHVLDDSSLWHTDPVLARAFRSSGG